MKTIKHQNRNGRPVKSAVEKKGYKVCLKMATEEYYSLKSKARLAGVTLSEYVRSVVKKSEGASIKCKRSAIINLCYCKSFRKNPPMIVMDNGAIFKMSKRNVQDFIRITNNLPRISPPCFTCYTCRNDKCENRMVFYQQKKAEQNNEPKEE